jgi:hypothetical protein
VLTGACRLARAAAVGGVWLRRLLGWLRDLFTGAAGVGTDSVRYVVAALIVADLVLGLTALLGFRKIRA